MKAKQYPLPNSLGGLNRALDAMNEAENQGRTCSFHWEDGRFVQPLTISDVPKKARPVCGATCRNGTPCKSRVCLLPDGSAGKRCRLHGGLSTGPKSQEGRERIAASNRARTGRKRAVSSNAAKPANARQQKGLQILAEIERRQAEGLPLVPSNLGA